MVGGNVPPCREKLLIIGHGRHGKDTVGNILAEKYGFRTISSSEFAAQKAVFPLVADLWPDWLSCYEDRHAHRDLWFHAIAAYNLRPGPSLAEQILVDHDIYTGMRSQRELEVSRLLFDRVIWVDRSEVLPPEGIDTMELTSADADFVLDNNSDMQSLEDRVAWMICRFSVK